MTHKSWLDDTQSALEHFRNQERPDDPQAVELAMMNQIRAQSGDRPLTMAEFIEIGENSRRGIHVYMQYAPKGFFQRMQASLKAAARAFTAGMRK